MNKQDIINLLFEAQQGKKSNSYCAQKILSVVNDSIKYHLRDVLPFDEGEIDMICEGIMDKIYETKI